MTNSSKTFEDTLIKGVASFKKDGLGTFLVKTARYLKQELFGQSFIGIIWRINYQGLWRKVGESKQSKSFPVFLFRFLVVLFFGWIVLFLPKKPFISAPLPEIKNWFGKNHKSLTVVIPTYKDYSLVKNCVNSIAKLPSSRFIKIIIVDDGSPKEIQDRLIKLNLPARIILKEKNEGFAKTCNAGMEAVKTGDILLLNNDTLVHDGWIESLQYYAYSAKDIGIVGAKLIYEDGSIQWAGSHRNTDAPEWFDHNFRFKPHDYQPANIPVEVLGVTGACMYIKREVINKIGFLDPNFEMAFEDMDYSLRAWESGFKLLYAPAAVVTHLESKTRGKKQGGREIRSLNYFWSKWKSWFDDRNVKNSTGQTRIIYVMQDTGVAGGHRVIFEHLNGLQELGYDVSLYSLAGTPKWFPLKVPVKSFSSYRLLEKDLKEQEAIKVATWWETSPSVWRSSVTKGIPVYFVQDIETSYYHEGDPMRQHVVAWYKKEFSYLTTSGWNKKQLSELGLNSTIVAPAVNSQVFKLNGLPREKNTLLALGRSHPLKNLNFTTKAWKRLRKRPKLVLFGIEPSLGRKLRVDYIFSPNDSKVADLYNQATVFIQTSFHEGFCLTILEAMACGAAVICTNADGNMDFCVSGKNCLIVEQNNVSQLAIALRKLFDDEELRLRLSKAGLETAKRYTYNKKNKELDKFYLKVTKNLVN